MPLPDRFATLFLERELVPWQGFYALCSLLEPSSRLYGEGVGRLC